MRELLREVHKLEKAELARANKAFPLFNSDHEGIAVLEEEIYEAEKERRDVIRVFKTMRVRTFEDMPEGARHDARRLKISALLAACEYIQVAAMAEKFCMDKDSFTQEDADRLSEGYAGVACFSEDFNGDLEKAAKEWHALVKELERRDEDAE